jgi:hypothetical protein
VTVVDQPENGVIWQRAIELFDCNDGSFSYVPDAGFAGIDTFTYTISDGLETSSLATVELHVMNTPPSVADESYNLPSEESRLTGNVLENDFDADGDALRAELVQPPQHGELRLRDDGTFTYIADPNYGGTDSFVYQVVDGVVGAQRQASANITVQGPAPGGQNAPGQTVPLDLDTPSVLAEVNITSEHGVLVENTKDVLSDSGARYPTVEYRHELQGSGGDVIPITHTWDSKLNVDVRFESLNIFAGTQYRISAALSKGDSDPLAVVPTQPILFFVGQPKVANVDHVATDTLTSTNKLPREIAHWDASVSWILEIKNNNGQWESVFAATSKHEIFLIADVPDSAAGAPTYVRMAQSVRYVGNSVNWSTNPTWARVVVNTLRNHKFNLEESAGLINTDAPKAARFWKVPETWTLLNGSDCYSGAAWTELVTKMVGVPGTITSKRVSPESFENHTTPAQPERQRFPYTEIYREGAYSWNKALVMIDNGDNPNNFEGTVIYTTEPDENDQTKTFYIPVGWGENVYAREEDMLLLFKSVAWRVPENKHWGTRARNLAEKEYDANPATPERDDPVPVDIDNY